MPGNRAGTIKRGRSMVITARVREKKESPARAAQIWRRLCEKAQGTPLAYKLSFFITILVVSCMILLGTIIVGKQK